MTGGVVGRAARLHETGGPEVLRLEEIVFPSPEAGQVLIRVEAIGVNRVDALKRAGRSGAGGLALPAFLGLEASGTVAQVGAEVTAFVAGDAVDILPGVAALPFGVYGDYAIIEASGLTPRPPGLSAVESAALWSAHLTAYAPLAEIARAGPGDTVLVTAASSGVGVAAIGIARALGARPIAVTRTSAKRARLLELGAAEVIASQEEDLAARVREITDGRGARIAFDAVAGPFLTTLADAVATDGIIVHYGNLSGQATPLPFAVLARNLTIAGYALDLRRDPARRDRAVRFITEQLAAGRLRPVVHARYRLDQAGLAHAALEANDHVGKIVLLPKGDA